MVGECVDGRAEGPLRTCTLGYLPGRVGVQGHGVVVAGRLESQPGVLEVAQEVGGTVPCEKEVGGFIAPTEGVGGRELIRNCRIS